MKILRNTRVLSALLLALCAGRSFAADPPAAPSDPSARVQAAPPNPILPNMQNMPAAAPPPIEKLAPGIYRIGEIVVNKNLRAVTFPALVNMDKGLLEYLLVRTGGKTHESLLRTLVDPYQVQLAFLLLGFEGTDRPLARQGDPARPRGEQVVLTITTTGGDGKQSNVKPEEWIVKRSAEALKAPGTLDLVYTGSVVSNKRFMAQVDGSIVALYHDPLAIIDNASAGGESDKIWFVNAGATPPPGTKVAVTIRSLKLSGGPK